MEDERRKKEGGRRKMEDERSMTVSIVAISYVEEN